MNKLKDVNWWKVARNFIFPGIPIAAVVGAMTMAFLTAPKEVRLALAGTISAVALIVLGFVLWNFFNDLANERDDILHHRRIMRAAEERLRQQQQEQQGEAVEFAEGEVPRA